MPATLEILDNIPPPLDSSGTTSRSAPATLKGADTSLSDCQRARRQPPGTYALDLIGRFVSTKMRVLNWPSSNDAGVKVNRMPLVASSFVGITISLDARLLPGMKVWPSRPSRARTFAVYSTRPLGSMPVS